MTLTVLSDAGDRRRKPRVDTSLTVEALDGGASWEVLNLSLGGLLVKTTTTRWPGQHVPIRMRLPTDPLPIRATCRVLEPVRLPSGELGLALRFLALAPRAELALLRHMAATLRVQRRRPADPLQFSAEKIAAG